MDVSTNSVDSILSFSDDDIGNKTPRQRGTKPNRQGSLNKSDVFANSQMTSFRVSRRSQITSPDDLMPTSRPKNLSKRRGSMGSRSDAMRSMSTDGFEESGTTLILEELRLETNGDKEGEILASLSLHGGEKDSRRVLNPNDSWISTSSRNLGGNGEFAMVVEEHDNHEEEERQFDWKHNFYRRLAVFRIACGNFVNSMVVQVMMTITLVSNAVVLGALTFDSLPAVTISALEITDLVMLIAFTFEILLHGVYLGPRQLLKDSWLTFDSAVITVSWCFLDSNLSVLRSFRIFRVFSIVSRWESLRTLFEAIGSTIPKMASIWLSLLLFFYVFCVLFTNVWSGLYAEGYLDQNYFGNLGLTFVTLFQVMTLDSWAEVARQVMVYEPWAFFGFFVFILFTAFFIVNLVVAVICESLIQMSRRAPDKDEDGSTMSLQADAAAPKHDDGLEVLMRQMLENQAEMAASIRELRAEIKALKARKVPIYSMSTAQPAKCVGNVVVDSENVPKDDASLVLNPPARSHVVEVETSLEVQVVQVERTDSSDSDAPRDYVASLRDHES
ncbi:hypothetical protein MHU86_6636 [Fragilaria crotonensis]|nr:hypothetical protein MHU86_6636 [Fragilaria crotonensis]